MSEGNSLLKYTDEIFIGTLIGQCQTVKCLYFARKIYKEMAPNNKLSTLTYFFCKNLKLVKPKIYAQNLEFRRLDDGNMSEE